MVLNHVRATITEKRDHPKRTEQGLVVEKVEVFNQENMVVLVCEHLYLMERKEFAEKE